ncbi:hypothetical protein ABKN59_010910 [Abortiporus biennis]
MGTMSSRTASYLIGSENRARHCDAVLTVYNPHDITGLIFWLVSLPIVSTKFFKNHRCHLRSLPTSHPTNSPQKTSYTRQPVVCFWAVYWIETEANADAADISSSTANSLHAEVAKKLIPDFTTVHIDHRFKEDHLPSQSEEGAPRLFRLIKLLKRSSSTPIATELKSMPQRNLTGYSFLQELNIELVKARKQVREQADLIFCAHPRQKLILLIAMVGPFWQMAWVRRPATLGMDTLAIGEDLEDEDKDEPCYNDDVLLVDEDSDVIEGGVQLSDYTGWLDISGEIMSHEKWPPNLDVGANLAVPFHSEDDMKTYQRESVGNWSDILQYGSVASCQYLKLARVYLDSICNNPERFLGEEEEMMELGEEDESFEDDVEMDPDYIDSTDKA